MTMKTLERALALILGIFCTVLPNSCLNDFPAETLHKMKYVSFSIEEDLRSFEPDGTKGIFSDMLCTDENGMGEIVVAAYELSTGKYASSVYIENLSEDNICRLELKDNCAYKVYALVNMGNIIPPSDSKDMEGMLYTVPESQGIVDKNGFLPMSGSTTIDTGSGLSAHIYVKRLVAEIRISYNCSDEVSIIPYSVRLCNVPEFAYPFSDGGSSGKMSEEGDKASDYDLGSFAKGEEIRMFMLENTSWPENTDGTLRVQDISETPPENASWIELECDIANSAGIVDARIRYRIALDFKIERNKRYTINFTVTPEGIFKDSWSVEVWDALIDMEEDIYMQSMSMTKISLPIEEYTNVTFSSTDEGIIRVAGHDILAMKKGSAYVKAVCKIGSYHASGRKKVTVVDKNEDLINVSDKEILLGATGRVSFFANLAEEVTLTTPGGTINIDASYNTKGDLRVYENDYLYVEYDPTQPKMTSRFMNVKVKKLPNGDEGTFSGSVNSITENKGEFEIKASVPELTYRIEGNEVCESGTSVKYIVAMEHNGETVSKNDFDPELYRKYYGSISQYVSLNDNRHIGIETLTQSSGVIYGKEANGRNSYTGTVMFKYNSEIGNLEKGKKTVEITVTPAFIGKGGRLADINNRILYTSGKFRAPADIPAEDVRTSEVQIRHLGWDRQWDQGRELSDNESIHRLIQDEKTLLELSPNTSGPYAMRLSKENKYTGKVFETIYYFDIYLNIEVGMHIPWSENMNYRLDLEIIFNTNATNSRSCEILQKLYEMNPKVLMLNRQFGKNGTDVFTVGTRIDNWNVNDDFFYNDTAHAQLPLCVNFFDSIINQFVNKKFVYRLYNPFTESDLSEKSFVTDEEVSEKHFSGKAILLKFNLADKFLYSVTHYGCSWGTGYADGYTETNRY